MFARYDAIGAFASMAALGRPFTAETGAQARANDLPLPAAVVRFERGD